MISIFDRMRLNLRFFSLLPVIAAVLLLLASESLLCKPANYFSISFTTGAGVGNLEITQVDCEMKADSSGGLSHLVMNRPGRSELSGVFSLEKVPPRLYIQMNVACDKSTEALQAGSADYVVYVNGNRSHGLLHSVPFYTIEGTNIARYCNQGRNTFSIKYGESSKLDLWIRQVYITPVGSFVDQTVEQGRLDRVRYRIPLLIAFFIVTAITLSYLLFFVLWKNKVNPQFATVLAIMICGTGFVVFPFLVLDELFVLWRFLIACISLVAGIIWIIMMHR